MALKGTQAKQEIAKIILDAFGDKAFLYNDGKEIRINWTEAGELIQIKLALTAAKVAVEKDGDNALPGANITPSASIPRAERIDFDSSTPPVVSEPTVEEKQNIKELMARLGL